MQGTDDTGGAARPPADCAAAADGSVPPPLDFDAAAALVAGAKRILVSGHLSPDGDSLGCMIAVQRALSSPDRTVVAAADPHAFGSPGFLEGAKDILPLRRLRGKRFDLLLCVDCASGDRLPPEVRPFAARLPVLAIDHHLTNTNFGKVGLVDPQASSAGEIVWKFLKHVGAPIDRASAEALWVAIVTDSGRFAYDSTRPDTMLAAADLLRHGVRTALINDILYCSFKAKSIALKRRAWRSLHIWKNRKVAEVTVTREDFREVRGAKADIEDAVEIPRSVSGNEIALFFYQLPDRTHETRVSIRTRAPWDATALAGRFGGGGHLRAAGCTVKAPLSAAKRLVRAAVADMMKPRKSAPPPPAAQEPPHDAPPREDDGKCPAS